MRVKHWIKQLLCGVSLVTLSAILHSSFAVMPSHSESVAIKAEIKQLVDDYGVYRDNFDGSGYASLFAKDGKFIFRGDVFQGRETLKKRIDEADPATVFMHMMSSGHIEIHDETTATGTHYAAIYSVTLDESARKGGPISVQGPSVIGKYNDKYVRTDEGWKFAERSFTPVFNTSK